MSRWRRRDPWGSALAYWQADLLERLDELEGIHASATGVGRGRRWGTVQFNGQLFVAVVGQFRAYARALHDEALDWLRALDPVDRQLAELAARSRNLDRGNPRSSSLGEDFGRLGMRFSTTMRARHNGATRIKRLDAAVTLRNGIAHGDATKIGLAAADGARPTLASYRAHRSCDQRIGGGHGRCGGAPSRCTHVSTTSVVTEGQQMNEPRRGSRVLVEGGPDGYVEAQVEEVYGPPRRRHVLVSLTPEMSGDVVDAPETLSVPLAAVRETEAA